MRIPRESRILLLRIRGEIKSLYFLRKLRTMAAGKDKRSPRAEITHSKFRGLIYIHLQRRTPYSSDNHDVWRCCIIYHTLRLVNFNRAFYFALSADIAKIDARVAGTGSARPPFMLARTPECYQLLPPTTTTTAIDNALGREAHAARCHYRSKSRRD